MIGKIKVYAVVEVLRSLSKSTNVKKTTNSNTRKSIALNTTLPCKQHFFIFIFFNHFITHLSVIYNIQSTTFPSEM